MKLRINKQSIRLRLSQQDVTELSVNGSISNTLNWGLSASEIFSYELRLIESGISQIKIDQNKIVITILKSAISEWLLKEEIVSFEHVYKTSSSPLLLLVERDFKCLTPRKEDESGLFENPNVIC